MVYYIYGASTANLWPAPQRVFNSRATTVYVYLAVVVYALRIFFLFIFYFWLFDRKPIFHAFPTVCDGYNIIYFTSSRPRFRVYCICMIVVQYKIRADEIYNILIEGRAVRCLKCINIYIIASRRLRGRGGRHFRYITHILYAKYYYIMHYIL